MSRSVPSSVSTFESTDLTRDAVSMVLCSTASPTFSTIFSSAASRSSNCPRALCTSSVICLIASAIIVDVPFSSCARREDTARVSYQSISTRPLFGPPCTGSASCRGPGA